MTAPALRILSLGAGVQSTTMALMAAHGLLGHVDAAIFADTGAEPAPVYDHLRWLTSPNVLPFPVHVVMRGHLRDDMRADLNTTGGRFVSVPFFGRTPAGATMMARRQCTSEYKLKPIRAWVVQEYQRRTGLSRPTASWCEMLIGISVDEVIRAKPSRVRYIDNAHPLLDVRMRRWDCLRWLDRHGYPRPPKSACSECPFRTNAEWRWLRENDPAGFEHACVSDEMLRQGIQAGRFQSELYLHRSLVPLRVADLRSDEERGQLAMPMLNECEGMCGV
ncbi:adenine nucleotide alpha hydrolase family protein [Rhodovarius crocodyli]|uniref:hypothetical protein n=1 Tax=Rhodovarius crocodyli TaxID=1979269 RepID=UPI001F0C5489|nr:hypothetical protein [Rhodovarius crocodyli]